MTFRILYPAKRALQLQDSVWFIAYFALFARASALSFAASKKVPKKKGRQAQAWRPSGNLLVLHPIFQPVFLAPTVHKPRCSGVRNGFHRDFYNWNLNGRVYFTLTALPSFWPGFHFGLSFSTRITSSAKS